MAFVGVLGIDELDAPEDGAEVLGFIAGCHQFVKWARSAK
jgi:hypothetical protein